MNAKQAFHELGARLPKSAGMVEQDLLLTCDQDHDCSDCSYLALLGGLLHQIVSAMSWQCSVGYRWALSSSKEMLGP